MAYTITRRDGTVLYTDFGASDVRAALSAARWPLPCIKLHNADLANTDLTGLDLTNADLANADFTNANLQDVDFSRANLDKCDFTGANLYGVDFTGANLSNIITVPQWVIQGQVRSDGRQFFLQRLSEDELPMIKVGTVYLSMHAAKAWYSAVEGTRGNPEETRIIIQALVDTAAALGLR